MSDYKDQEAKIKMRLDELSRTNPKSPRYKERLTSLRDIIKQYNWHVEDKYRLAEVSQYPSVYELREV